MTETPKRNDYPTAVRLHITTKLRYTEQGLGLSAGLSRDLKRYERVLLRGRLSLQAKLTPLETIRILDTTPEQFAHDAESIVAAVAGRPLATDELYALIDGIESARGLIAAGVEPLTALYQLGLVNTNTYTLEGQ